MENKRIYLSSPTMNGSEIEYIKEAIASNFVAPLGPNVNEFENEIASYVGTKHAAAVSSGTAALHLALKYVGVRQGDIVLCSTLTFSASCNPIVYLGATPVFIDSEKESWNMDPVALRRAIQKYPQAKAVVVVNLYGTPALLPEILEICNGKHIPLIEDAAESLGATCHGRQTGTFGCFGIYSFNGNKIITTSGGGMLVSEDGEAIEKAKFWATQAREKERYYEHKEIGYNYRMSNILAGIGRGQLLSLKEYIKLKKNIYCTYQEAFDDIEEITMNPIPPDCEPNYWLSCITLNKECKVKPFDLILALEEDNIEARPVWKPMHLQPVFQGCDLVKAKDNTESIATDIFNRGICLPSDIKLTKDELDRIIRIVTRCIKAEN